MLNEELRRRLAALLTPADKSLNLPIRLRFLRISNNQLLVKILSNINLNREVLSIRGESLWLVKDNYKVILSNINKRTTPNDHLREFLYLQGSHPKFSLILSLLFDSSASNNSTIPPHDLQFDIGADWGFEWMQLPQL